MAGGGGGTGMSKLILTLPAKEAGAGTSIAVRAVKSDTSINFVILHLRFVCPEIYTQKLIMSTKNMDCLHSPGKKGPVFS
jgi:hypothetical protein